VFDRDHIVSTEDVQAAMSRLKTAGFDDANNRLELRERKSSQSNRNLSLLCL